MGARGPGLWAPCSTEIISFFSILTSKNSLEKGHFCLFEKKGRGLHHRRLVHFYMETHMGELSAIMKRSFSSLGSYDLRKSIKSPMGLQFSIKDAAISRSFTHIDTENNCGKRSLPWRFDELYSVLPCYLWQSTNIEIKEECMGGNWVFPRGKNPGACTPITLCTSCSSIEFMSYSYLWQNFSNYPPFSDPLRKYHPYFLHSLTSL